VPECGISGRGIKVSLLDNCVLAQISPLAERINAQGQRPLAAFWGDGKSNRGSDSG